MGIVNGKISKPDLDSPLYEDWESCNTMVLSWLINSMAHTILKAIATLGALDAQNIQTMRKKNIQTMRKKKELQRLTPAERCRIED